MKVKEIARRIVALRAQRALLADLCDRLATGGVGHDPSNIEAINIMLLEQIDVREEEIKKLENSEVSGGEQKPKSKQKAKSKSKRVSKKS